MPTKVKGRPPRSDEASTKQLGIALTKKEYEKVTEVAKKHGEATTTFWREKILETAEKIKHDEKDD